MAACDQNSVAATRQQLPSGAEPSMAAPEGPVSLNSSTSHTCARPGCAEPASICVGCYSAEAGIADRLQGLEARLAKVTAELSRERTLRLTAEATAAADRARANELEGRLLSARTRRDYDERMWSRLAQVLGQVPSTPPEALVQLARFETLLEATVRQWIDDSPDDPSPH